MSPRARGARPRCGAKSCQATMRSRAYKKNAARSSPPRPRRRRSSDKLKPRWNRHLQHLAYPLGRSTLQGWMTRNRRPIPSGRIKPDVVLAPVMMKHAPMRTQMPFQCISLHASTFSSNSLKQFLPRSMQCLQRIPRVLKCFRDRIRFRDQLAIQRRSHHVPALLRFLKQQNELSIRHRISLGLHAITITICPSLKQFPFNSSSDPSAALSATYWNTSPPPDAAPSSCPPRSQ